MTVHRAAAVGFDREAASYAAVRPGYPDAVLEVLASAGAPAPARIADVAAGTGILTRQLLAAGYGVVAVDPVEGMRRQLAASTPGAHLVGAVAEALPLRAATMHAVTAAQAFHWFDAPAALAEIHRVLRRDGVLLMCWNVRDESVDWMRAWTDLVHDMSGGRPYTDHRERDWADVVAESGRFTPLQYRRVPNPFDATPATVVERTRSTSFVAALDPQRQREVLDAVAALVARHPQTAGRERFEFPNQSDVHWCRRRD